MEPLCCDSEAPSAFPAASPLCANPASLGRRCERRRTGLWRAQPSSLRPLDGSSSSCVSESSISANSPLSCAPIQPRAPISKALLLTEHPPDRSISFQPGGQQGGTRRDARTCSIFMPIDRMTSAFFASSSWFSIALYSSKHSFTACCASCTRGKSRTYWSPRTQTPVIPDQ